MYWHEIEGMAACVWVPISRLLIQLEEKSDEILRSLMMFMLPSFRQKFRLMPVINRIRWWVAARLERWQREYRKNVENTLSSGERMSEWASEPQNNDWVRDMQFSERHCMRFSIFAAENSAVGCETENQRGHAIEANPIFEKIKNTL